MSEALWENPYGRQAVSIALPCRDALLFLDSANSEESTVPSDFSPEERKKLGRSLQHLLQREGARSSKPLRVTISVRTEPPPLEKLSTSAERAEALRQAFEAEVQPLVDALKAEGGAEFRVHWIANAFTASLPASSVFHAVRHRNVTRIDLVEQKHGLI